MFYSMCPDGGRFKVRDPHLSLFILMKLGAKNMICEVNPELHKEARKVLANQIGEWVTISPEAEIEIEN